MNLKNAFFVLDFLKFVFIKSIISFCLILFCIQSKPTVHFAVNVSYIEIYMEELCDLLDLDNKNLHVREDEKGNTGNKISFHHQITIFHHDFYIYCIQSCNVQSHVLCDPKFLFRKDDFIMYLVDHASFYFERPNYNTVSVLSSSLFPIFW